MKKVSIDKAIANSAASLAMEGYHIDEQCRDWCRQLLQGKLTIEEYIALVKESAGIIT